uniref:Uncharacterized protein n=1 Tax=viral metagenome TaxID=1070528 RepID=A0A6C0BNQ9_9ZZZZ
MEHFTLLKLLWETECKSRKWEVKFVYKGHRRGQLDLDDILDKPEEYLKCFEYDDIPSLIVGFKAITDYDDWRLRWYVKDNLKQMTYLEPNPETYYVYVQVEAYPIEDVVERKDCTF